MSRSSEVCRTRRSSQGSGAQGGHPPLHLRRFCSRWQSCCNVSALGSAGTFLLFGLGHPPTSPPPAPRPETSTQEIAERWVQHPQEQQELPELPLHGLLTLLEVPVLRERGPREAPAPEPSRGPDSRPCPEPHHQLHEAAETPEGIHLVLSDVEDWGEKVTHALDVTWGDTRSGAGPGLWRPAPREGPAPGPARPWLRAHRTEVEVVHAVGEEDVVQQAQPRVLGALVKFVGPVGAAHVSLCGHRAQRAKVGKGPCPCRPPASQAEMARPETQTRNHSKRSHVSGAPGSPAGRTLPAAHSYRVLNR